MWLVGTVDWHDLLFLSYNFSISAIFYQLLILTFEDGQQTLYIGLLYSIFYSFSIPFARLSVTENSFGMTIYG